MSKGKIAVVDLMFQWPPHGGACTDLKETFSRLVKKGYEVKLFVPLYTAVWARGRVDESALPFEVVKVPFSGLTFNFHHVPKKMKEEVDKFNPDYLFLGDSAFLKPYLIDEFAKDYPVTSRFYTYELICFKYYEFFRKGKKCEYRYLENPVTCLFCGTIEMAEGLFKFNLDLWSHEFVVGLGFLPGFHKKTINALKKCKHLIVYNKPTGEIFNKYNKNVHVISGGVDISEFPEKKRKIRRKDRKIRILMSGRADDPRKGLKTIEKAGRILWEKRQDFEIYVTFQGVFKDEFLHPLGWLTHDELKEEYEKADLVIVPSIWEEPFGIVAVEAGAMSLPVISTSVGGLQEIVENGKTGFVTPPKAEKKLAEKINYYLDNRKELIEMGKAGRKRVIQNYNWDDIVERNYPSIFS